MDKNKLKNLLSKLDSVESRLPGNETNEYLDSLLTEQTEKFKKQLQENPTVKILDAFNKKLDQLKKDFNLNPIITEIEKIQKDVVQFKQSSFDEFQKVSNQNTGKSREMDGLVSKLRNDVDGLSSKDIKGILDRISGIEKDLNLQADNSDRKGKSLLELTQGLEIKLNKALKDLTDNSSNQSEYKTSLEKRLGDKEKETKELIESVRKEFLSRISSFRGGGQANRNIAVNGNTSVLSKYTDINIKAGTNVTLTHSNNNTSKYLELTIAASGGGGGISSVLAGTGITIDNTTPTTPIVNLGTASVTAGTYGSATQVGQFTVDAQGRLSAASNIGITGNTELQYLIGINSSVVSINNVQTISNKTLVTPSVASFAQAQHSHQDGAGGGILNASSVFSMTGGQVKTSVLGTGTASPTTFLRGDSTWAAPAGAAKQFHFIGPYDSRSQAFGVTDQFYGFISSSTTEADTQWVVPLAGTFKNLYFRASANTVNGNTTIFIRKGGVNTTLTVIFGSTVSGVQSDAVNSFTVVAGDLISTKITTAGTSGSITFGGSTMEFDPS